MIIVPVAKERKEMEEEERCVLVVGYSLVF